MKNKLGHLLAILWVLTIIAPLAFSCWIIYVIFHFVVKYW
jgi:hypothetical protein